MYYTTVFGELIYVLGKMIWLLLRPWRWGKGLDPLYPEEEAEE